MSVRYRSNIPRIENQIKLTVPKALQLGANMIAESAKERVPVRTGRLRDAIHVEKRAAGVNIGGRHYGAQYSDWAVVAGDNKVFYGHMVEYGTTRAPAQPFLIPAFESRQMAVRALVAQALKRLR